jgi:ATP-binding cassette, subfamily F, member 3
MQVLPDYSSGNNEKDIHVHNFGIEIGGLVLLEGADLKLSFGRKYGLTGKNGIGKCAAQQHITISLLLLLL